MQGTIDTVLGTTTSLYQPGTPGGELEGFWSVDATHPATAFSAYAVTPRQAHKHYVCKRAVTEFASFP